MNEDNEKKYENKLKAIYEIINKPINSFFDSAQMAMQLTDFLADHSYNNEGVLVQALVAQVMENRKLQAEIQEINKQ